MPVIAVVVMSLWLMLPGQPEVLVAHSGFADMPSCQDAVEEAIGGMPEELAAIASFRATCVYISGENL